MKIVKLLTLALAIGSTAQAQLPGFAINTGKSVVEGIKDKKQAKLINESLTEKMIDGMLVKTLRVPDDKINSAYKAWISKLQLRLDQCAAQYAAGERITGLENRPTVENQIRELKELDREWPVAYYSAEMEAYRTHDEKLAMRQQATEDSLEQVQALAAAEAKRKADEEAAVAKLAADEEAAQAAVQAEYEARIEGYHFINKNYVSLKEKAAETSQTIGRAYVGSYVKVIGFSEGSSYVKVSLDDVQGFVKEEDLVDDVFLITVDGADLDLYSSKVYTKFTRNVDYKAPPAPKAPVARVANDDQPSSGISYGSTRSSTKKSSGGGRSYLRGPRGGCYYINSNGNKTYVDKSLCN